jgi:hypothetical protein
MWPLQQHYQRGNAAQRVYLGIPMLLVQSPPLPRVERLKPDGGSRQWEGASEGNPRRDGRHSGGLWPGLGVGRRAGPPCERALRASVPERDLSRTTGAVALRSEYPSAISAIGAETMTNPCHSHRRTQATQPKRLRSPHMQCRPAEPRR